MSSKRLSSEFNFAPQFKRHIGEMDVDYVFDRQAVYDKTIEVLFKGAKISQNKQPKADMKTCTSTSVPADTDSKHCLKQTVLNNKCQLQKTTLLNQPTEVISSQFDKCAFCERLSCFTILLQCSNCKDYFCNNCSFPGAEFEDKTLCISCFK